MNKIVPLVGYDDVGGGNTVARTQNTTVMASGVSPSDNEVRQKAEQVDNVDLAFQSIAPNQYSPASPNTKTTNNDRMNIYVYPTDLGLNPELQNYMQFEMFESGGSALTSNSSSLADRLAIPKTIAGIDIEAYRTAVNNNAQLTQAAIAGTTAVVGSAIGDSAYFGSWAAESRFSAIATPLGGAISAVVGINSLLYSGAAGTIGTSLIENFGAPTDRTGMGDYSFVAETTGLGTANKRISKTILLYLPSNLKTSYGVEYTEENFDIMTEVMGDLKVIGGTLHNLVSQTPQDNNQAGMQAAFQQIYARKALGIAGKAIGGMLGVGDPNLAKFYEATTRKVTNPFVVNLFKSVKRRSFEFAFRFTPRSLPEVAMVSNIIKYFRMYALPKRAQELAGRFLDYPAEFRIKFFHNGVENMFLPKIARCALKDVSLTFGDEQFTTFAPIENLGAPPTKIDMTLTFEELEIMTQDRIEQGY